MRNISNLHWNVYERFRSLLIYSGQSTKRTIEMNGGRKKDIELVSENEKKI